MDVVRAANEHSQRSFSSGALRRIAGEVRRVAPEFLDVLGGDILRGKAIPKSHSEPPTIIPGQDASTALTNQIPETKGTWGPAVSWFYETIATRSKTRKIFYQFVANDVQETISSRKTVTRVLDVGTGNGIVPALVAPKAPNTQFYAIDPSKAQLRIAEKRVGQIPNVHLALGSDLQIPFDEKFELIYASLAVRFWENLKRSFEYMSGHLKDGGEIRIYRLYQEADEETNSRRRITRELKSIIVDRILRTKQRYSVNDITTAAKEAGMKASIVSTEEGFKRIGLVRRA